MVTVFAPIVTVPSRAPPLFWATASRTAPLPVPLAPLATVIQLALLRVVQVQPSGAVTLNAASPPEAPTAREEGVTPTVHAGGGAGVGGAGSGPGGAGGGGAGGAGGAGTGPPAAACAIVTDTPAIVTVPLRAGPEFAPTEMRIDALPVPL